MKAKKKAENRGSTVRAILKYLKRYHALILLSALLAMASVAISIYIPIRIGNAIDLIVGYKNVALKEILYILIEIAVFYFCYYIGLKFFCFCYRPTYIR